VSPELVQVRPGAAPTTTWQQGFDASLTDVFQVQADIATKVASALNVALGDSARQRPRGAADREPGGLRRLSQRRGRLAGPGRG
jgi:hypothetical protein